MCCQLLVALLLFKFLCVCNTIILEYMYNPCGEMSSFIIKPCHTARSSAWYLAKRKPSLPPPPHLQKLFVTVKKCAKTVHTKQCKYYIMAHYWCCQHCSTLPIQKTNNFLIFEHMVPPIYWCCWHCSTNVLMVTVTVAPIYWWKHVSSTQSCESRRQTISSISRPTFREIWKVSSLLRSLPLLAKKVSPRSRSLFGFSRPNPAENESSITNR